MKKLKKNNALLLALLVLAGCLMIFSGVQTSRAALTIYSDIYVEQIQLSQIGVTLMENGADVAWRDFIGLNDTQHSQKEADQLWDTNNTGVLLGHMLGEGEEFKVGTTYPEEIRVRNSGEIDEYVRVILRRYWMHMEKQKDKNGNVLKDANGNDIEIEVKTPFLDPTLIALNVVNSTGFGNGTERGGITHSNDSGAWIFNADESTEETLVFYYSRLLHKGEITEPLINNITVDKSLSYRITNTYVDEEGYTVIETYFDYDGSRFMLEAEADAVQSHNAATAMRSAWGFVIPGVN